MALIQAHRRAKRYVHQFPHITLVFEPNELGDVVCDVQDEHDVEVLLRTPTGFRLYDQPTLDADGRIASLPPLLPPLAGSDPDPGANSTPEGGKVASDNSDPTPPTSPYLVKHGEHTLDLGLLEAPQLRQFAKDCGIKLPPTAKDDTLRRKIVEALTQPGSDSEGGEE